MPGHGVSRVSRGGPRRRRTHGISLARGLCRTSHDGGVVSEVMESKLGPVALTIGAMVLALGVFMLVGRVSGSTRLRGGARRAILTLLSTCGAFLLVCAAYGLVVVARGFRT